MASNLYHARVQNNIHRRSLIIAWFVILKEQKQAACSPLEDCLNEEFLARVIYFWLSHWGGCPWHLAGKGQKVAKHYTLLRTTSITKIICSKFQ